MKNDIWFLCKTNLGSELLLQEKISQKWLLHLHQVLEKKLAEENFITTHCGGLAGVLVGYMNI